MSIANPMLITSLVEYTLLRNALLVGTLAAILAGVVGYFLVIRRLAFAGHALGHVGFAGATGAGLLNLSPLTGQLFLTVISAVGIGVLGHKTSKSDITIGIVLAFSLGLGVLFLHFYTNYASQAMSVLFGNLLAVSVTSIKIIATCALASLIAISLIARPLLFSSLEPELAEAKGVSLAVISLIFMLIVALTVTITSQVVGILLVFTLLVGPAASALNWTSQVMTGLLLTITIGVVVVWLGITAAFVTDWPIPFWISTLSAVTYLVSVISYRQLLKKRR